MGSWGDECVYQIEGCNGGVGDPAGDNTAKDTRSVVLW